MWWAHPALGVTLLAFALYLPSLGGGFIRDDHFLIESHPYLRAEGWLGRLLLGDFWAPVSGATGMWRPLVVLSYWIDGRIGGWAPIWFHVVNAGAHALASGAVSLLVLSAGSGAWAAWLAGLVFAALPAHVECVAWISGRTDVLCTLFGLLALWLDVRARGARKRWAGVPAVVALGLAMLSKESAVPLVGVLAVMEWVRMRASGDSLARGAAWVAPYAIVAAAYLISHGAFAPDPGAIAVPDLQSRAAMRGAGWALFPGYVAFLWPWFPHSPDRAAPLLANTPAAETMIGAACVAVALIGFAILVWRRAPTAPAMALALLPLAPPLVLASARGYGLYGERHIYLPSAGVVWALAQSLAAWGGRWGGRSGRVAIVAAASALALGSAVETLRIIPAYHDDETMYRTMVEREPENPTGFVGLAQQLTLRGRLDEALALLDRAGKLDPRMASIPVGRARVAQRRQDWGEMLAQSDRARSLDPGLQSAGLLHASALMALRRLDEAGRELARLREAFPGHPEVGTVWGQYLIGRGRPAEALPVLRSAAQLLPGEPSLWDAIGVASVQIGHWEDARVAFQRTVALSPEYLSGWLRLAAACQRLGDAAGRDQALDQASKLPGGAAAVAAFVSRFGIAR